MVQAYKNIEENSDMLGIILEYDELADDSTTIQVASAKPSKVDDVNIGFIGSGSYAETILIPAFKNTKSNLLSIASKNGLTGALIARKFNFHKSTTNLSEMFSDNDINTVVIATRHDSHCSLILDALKSGKNIFVEKPLCITFDELNKIREVHASISQENKSPILMVGLTEGFSSLVNLIKSELKDINQPLSINYNINAGYIPNDSWIQDKTIGGGRVIGEVCHFIDLVKFIVDDDFKSYHCVKADSKNKDTLAIILKFKGGSIANINYFLMVVKIIQKKL